jgi:hypothetical protein
MSPNVGHFRPARESLAREKGSTRFSEAGMLQKVIFARAPWYPTLPRNLSATPNTGVRLEPVSFTAHLLYQYNYAVQTPIIQALHMTMP